MDGNNGLPKMPSVKISRNKLHAALHSQEGPVSITTPLGRTILEIQGDLEIPLERIPGDPRFSKYNGSDEDVVKFGLLILDLNTQNATMYIGKKQRLLGSIVKLETPLGLLKFNKSSGTVELQDVFKYKIIFKDRPLPIM